jgi:outer membrane receptor protein involved in Fe transport
MIYQMKNLLVTIFMIIPGIFSGVMAQDAADTTGSPLNKLVELTEIVIKASKDNVTFKSIPASVSVISSAAMADNEIKTLSDISALAPNFYMPEYGSKLTSPVYIRGIGSRINSPSVGLYVDYVPYFEKAAFNFDFFDIKRVEVLRGPQGTLFGRNTMGGIINIVTTSPMDYNGSAINLSAGNYGTYSLNASHYDKPGDRFAYSLSANYVHNDGFYTNIYSGSRVDRLNSVGGRSRLIYELSDKLTVENIAGFEASRQGGYPYAIFNDTLKAAQDINYNQYSLYDRNLFSDAMLVKYAGDKFDITATTSYQYLSDYQGIDQDFTPDSLYYVIQKQNQNMVSQELVMKSKENRRYKWLFGAYGFFQAFDNTVDAAVYRSKLTYTKTYDHKIDGYALFHQSTLSDFPVKNMSVTAGLRIDAEKDYLHYTYDRTLNGNYASLSDTVYPALRSLEIIPRFAVNYRISGTGIYAVIARGYKTGGFNSTFERPEDLTFNPEYSWNYEAGVKTTLFSRRLYADLALYFIDWRNQQIYQTVPSGRGSMLKNAGHSSSRGAEVSLKSAPFHGFEFALSYGYTDAVFISYVVDTTTNYNGNKLPYVPANTLAAQAAKSIKVPNSKIIDDIRLNVIYRAAGEIWWNEKNTERQSFYGLLDAKASFSRRSLQVDIWARNLLNTEYASFFFEALGNKYVQVGKPAQFGVNMSVKF